MENARPNIIQCALLTLNWKCEAIFFALWSSSHKTFFLWKNINLYCQWTENFPPLFLVILVFQDLVLFSFTVNFLFGWKEFKVSKSLSVSSFCFIICIVYILFAKNRLHTFSIIFSHFLCYPWTYFRKRPISGLPEATMNLSHQTTIYRKHWFLG